MSRGYSMYLTIENHRAERREQLQAAAQEEWPFADWHAHEHTLSAEANASLAGGETEEEFCDRLAVALWRANGEYCPLTISAIYLDDLPHETHLRGEWDYERLIVGAGSEQPANADHDGSPPIAASHDYQLLLDGDLLRQQRELLNRLQFAFWNRHPFVAEPEDEALLEGLLHLTDALADQAHDRHGIVCLLEDDADATPTKPTSDLERPTDIS